MGQVEVDFDIPEEIGAVKHWFMQSLRPLAGVPYCEKPRVELILEWPRARNLHDPDVDTIVTEIVVGARRIERVHVESTRRFGFDFHTLEAHTGELGAVMVFRLIPLRGETYVVASCVERPATVWKVFEDFLKQIEARYPALGPFWRKYAAEQRARMREDLRARFGDTNTRGPGDTETRPANNVRGPGHGDTVTREQAPRTAPGVGDGATLQRRRGRKRTDPGEINKICADWLKVQHRETQTDFCNRKGISPSQLRSWLKGYPYPES